MADIAATVSAMPAADTSPVQPPAGIPPMPTELSAVLIRTIAKEMAQPWKYGLCISRFARVHGIPMAQAEEIYIALKAKQLLDS